MPRYCRRSYAILLIILFMLLMPLASPRDASAAALRLIEVFPERHDAVMFYISVERLLICHADLLLIFRAAYDDYA